MTPLDPSKYGAPFADFGLPTLTIAEAVALLVWMAQERGRDVGDRMLESAKWCATGQRSNILSAARDHYRRGRTCVDDDYDRCAAYVLHAAARGLAR